MSKGENNFIHVLSDRFSEETREDFLRARSLSTCDLAGVLKRMTRSRERWPRRARPDAGPTPTVPYAR